MEKEKLIMESVEAKIIEDLWYSGEWCMPRWSETKGCYIMIKKRSAIK